MEVLEVTWLGGRVVQALNAWSERSREGPSLRGRDGPVMKWLVFMASAQATFAEWLCSKNGDCLTAFGHNS